MTHTPASIIHALKHCESQQLGAYLGICNHNNCQHLINHGEPVTIHAYHSECNGWHITALHCRHHNPDTTFNTNHSHTTAIATAIFNHPTDIPHNPNPHLSDFKIIETTTELPQLEPPDVEPLTETELEDPDDQDTHDT